jgi:hypothetical protein
MAINKLTPRFVQSIKTKGMYADGSGLYLQVDSGGLRKSWIFRYHIAGRSDRQMAIGPLHIVTLAEARKRTRQYRKILVDAIDAIEQHGSDNLARKPAKESSITFARCAEEYLDRRGNEWTPSFTQASKCHIRMYLLPRLGDLPVDMIGVYQVYDALKPLYETKAATALVVRQHLDGILSWAIAKEYRVGLIGPYVRDRSRNCCRVSALGR